MYSIRRTRDLFQNTSRSSTADRTRDIGFRCARSSTDVDSEINSGHYYGPCITRYDMQGDGAIDRLVYHTYSENGLEIWTEIDNEVDGIVDRIHDSRYDEFDNLVEHRYDEDGNGIFDGGVSYHYTYDEDGRPLIKEFDQGMDGDLETRELFEYQNGLLVKYQIDYRNEAGNNEADGIIDSITEYEYNEEDQVVFERTDHDADGIIDAEYSFIYNNNGHLIEKRSGDQVLIAYENDIAGNILNEWRYDLIDGSIRSHKRFVYDSHSNLLISDRLEENGFVNWRETCSYDCWH